MNDQSHGNSSSGGIGFVGALTILFIALKLLGKITWSWWWVLSPIWISTLSFIAVLIIGFFIYLIIQSIKDRKHEQTTKNRS